MNEQCLLWNFQYLCTNSKNNPIIKHLIKKFKNIHPEHECADQFNRGFTHACRHGNIKIMKLLINSGVYYIPHGFFDFDFYLRINESKINYKTVIKAIDIFNYSNKFIVGDKFNICNHKYINKYVRNFIKEKIENSVIRKVIPIYCSRMIGEYLSIKR